MKKCRSQEKMRVESKIKKRYDKPQTPYQRLMNSDALTILQKEKLRQRFESLNPFELQQRIQQKLKIIFQYIDIKLKGRTGT
jgi:hypothetical protein